MNKKIIKINRDQGHRGTDAMRICFNLHIRENGCYPSALAVHPDTFRVILKEEKDYVANVYLCQNIFRGVDILRTEDIPVGEIRTY